MGAGEVACYGVHTATFEKGRNIEANGCNEIRLGYQAETYQACTGY